MLTVNLTVSAHMVDCLVLNHKLFSYSSKKKKEGGGYHISLNVIYLKLITLNVYSVHRKHRI